MFLAGRCTGLGALPCGVRDGRDGRPWLDETQMRMGQDGRTGRWLQGASDVYDQLLCQRVRDVYLDDDSRIDGSMVSATSFFGFLPFRPPVPPTSPGPAELSTLPRLPRLVPATGFLSVGSLRSRIDPLEDGDRLDELHTRITHINRGTVSSSSSRSPRPTKSSSRRSEYLLTLACLLLGDLLLRGGSL